MFLKSTLFQRNQSMPYYGIGNSKNTENNKLYNNYYQWVVIALFIQAMFMYLPRFLWINYESQIVDNLLLDNKIDRLDSAKQEQIRDYIIDLLTKKPRICDSYRYYYHVFIELLNLLNTFAQFVFMNYFLNMNFRDYGWKVWNFNDWSYEYYFDPMTKLFPKMTKCHFFDYGPSGQITKNDYLCILPLNVVNEKIYLVLWFWYQFLIVCSILNLINRFLLSFSNELRCKIIMKRMQIVNKRALTSIVFHISIGEWYILDVLSRNLDLKMFSGIIDGIYEILGQQRKDRNSEISV